MAGADFLLPRNNNALHDNPPNAMTNLTTGGSDWLWAVMAVFLFTALCFVVMQYLRSATPHNERIFNYLMTFSLLVGTITYFACASDISGIPVQQVDSLGRHPGTRQIFYARYINWFVGWTPLVIAVGLVSSVSWTTIVYHIALLWTWIASWLAGAFVVSRYKWGFFVFGTFALFLLSLSMLHRGSIASRRIDAPGASRSYLFLAGWLVGLWLIYPICWGLTDGGNYLSVTSSFIWFGIEDCLVQPGTALALLYFARKWDYRAMNLYFTQHGRVAQGRDHFDHEKVHGGTGQTTGNVPVTAGNASATHPSGTTQGGENVV